MLADDVPRTSPAALLAARAGRTPLPKTTHINAKHHLAGSAGVGERVGPGAAYPIQAAAGCGERRMRLAPSVAAGVLQWQACRLLQRPETPPNAPPPVDERAGLAGRGGKSRHADVACCGRRARRVWQHVQGEAVQARALPGDAVQGARLAGHVVRCIRPEVPFLCWEARAGGEAKE